MSACEIQPGVDRRTLRDLKLVGRDAELFSEDLQRHGKELEDKVRGRRFLVVGGAGSIGRAVVRELFSRQPAALHLVDINENGLAEIVRDLRASLGYLDGGDFQAFCFDALGPELDALLAAEKQYDTVLNFSALKHVRSEKDPLTLMRMLTVNVLGTQRTLHAAREAGA